jgi:hypothetical protein
VPVPVTLHAGQLTVCYALFPAPGFYATKKNRKMSICPGTSCYEVDGLHLLTKKTGYGRVYADFQA